MMELVWILVISLLVLFLSTAILLYVFPTIIFQHHDKLKSVRIAVHRGGAGEYIENTMAAFDNAVNLGADLLEIDVQETKDGVVIVSHDNDLSRVTGVHDAGFISDHLYENLPRLKNGLPLQFDRQCCLSNQTNFSFVKLNELFEKYPDVIVHIDTKDGKQSLIEKVSEIITNHNRFANTVWGNMSEQNNDVAYKINPDILIFMSIKKVIITYIMFYMGLIGFLPIKEAVFDIPMISAIIDQNEYLLTKGQKILGHIVNFFMMNRLLFWHLQRRGIKVIVFVINTETGFKDAEKYGVDGIMTDYPTKLVKFHAQSNKETSSDSDEQSQILCN